MKVSREEAAANRERIVEVASRLFRARGFDGIGLSDIMKGAGLTHGGFYGHFSSKEQLEEEACTLASVRSAERWNKIVDEAGSDGLSAILDGYLGEDRVNASEQGCLFALLGTDAARQGKSVRRSFADGFEALVGVLAKAIPGRARKERRERAIATFAEMVGAMVLARSVSDPELRQEILRVSRADIEAKRRAW